MRIGQLLAAGRSLVGQKDQVGRYRPVNPRSLPRFEQGTPGWLSGSDTTQPPAPAAAAESPAEPPAARVETARPKPAAFPGPVCRADLPVRRSFLGRLWAAIRPGKSAAPARAAASRRPVQAELRLEQVKVVRNDLSDADLEVVPSKAVPARPAEQKRPEPQEKPAGAVRSRALSILRVLS